MVNYDRVNGLITKNGITKAFVCEKLGKSRSWLNAAERKQYNMPERVIRQLSTILLTTPEYLRGETDNDSPLKDASAKVAEANNQIDVEIMLKYSQLSEKDRTVIDTMIDRLLSREG